jgi:hypothetical protein
MKLACVAAVLLTGYLLLGDTKAEQSAGAAKESTPQPSWRLSTDDTCMTVGIVDNRPAVYRLTDAAQKWNWTPSPAEFPLLAKVTMCQTNVTAIPNWTYRDAVVDGSNGTKLTLRFTSTTPKLELESVWWAQKGPGPIQEWMIVKNQTGGAIAINGVDVVAADLSVVADGSVKLWRFNKSPREGFPDAIRDV